MEIICEAYYAMYLHSIIEELKMINKINVLLVAMLMPRHHNQTPYI